MALVILSLFAVQPGQMICVGACGHVALQSGDSHVPCATDGCSGASVSDGTVFVPHHQGCVDVPAAGWVALRLERESVEVSGVLPAPPRVAIPDAPMVDAGMLHRSRLVYSFDLSPPPQRAAVLRSVILLV